MYKITEVPENGISIHPKLSPNASKYKHIQRDKRRGCERDVLDLPVPPRRDALNHLRMH